MAPTENTVRLVARRARRALVHVDVEDRVAGHRDGVRIRLVRVLDPSARLDLGEQDAVGQVVLVAACTAPPEDCRPDPRAELVLLDERRLSNGVVHVRDRPL
jgi:hypothetical protein